MVRAGDGGERGRYGHHRGPRQGHDPVGLGKPEVVADGEAQDGGGSPSGAGDVTSGTTTKVSPGAMVSDSRKSVWGSATSKRWSLRYTASTAPLGPNSRLVL